MPDQQKLKWSHMHLTTLFQFTWVSWWSNRNFFTNWMPLLKPSCQHWSSINK